MRFILYLRRKVFESVTKQIQTSANKSESKKETPNER